MKIACLGWGSLIWDPRGLNIEGGWKKDGPGLPVEFARRSGDGRLTLVLYPELEPVKVLWALMDTEDISESRKNLQAREGTIERYIDYIWKNEEYSYVLDSVEVVKGWAQEKGLDGVVWTGLYSNFEGKTGMEFTVENAVKYLDGLTSEDRKKAKEYIQKAPSQVRTPVRERVEDELGWQSEE